MTDIVERLRQGKSPGECDCTRCDAAAEIERLRGALADLYNTSMSHLPEGVRARAVAKNLLDSATDSSSEGPAK